MAKLKKTASKRTRGTTTSSKSKPASDRLGKSITESAQQIWLAGMGAFTRAQSEGSKLFETLVRDGLSLEQTARKFAGQRANVVRDVVEDHVGQARDRAADTWDKLEAVFEDRVQRALVKLGVPSRDDLNTLVKRVERLTEELRKAGATPKASKPAAKATKPAKAAKPAKTTAATKAAKPAKATAATKTAKPAKTTAATKAAKPAKATTATKAAKPAKATAATKAAKPAKSTTSTKAAKPTKTATVPKAAKATTASNNAAADHVSASQPAAVKPATTTAAPSATAPSPASGTDSN